MASLTVVAMAIDDTLPYRHVALVKLSVAEVVGINNRLLLKGYTRV